ncbi:DNA replication/repair protein RecF [Endozoicomonas montiporae]|uniref:DNA replication and repair protein RecF n=1 Tax=Endozoicomonas montiporae CL-33 TaxID=570277 RepID=A0A142B6A3_9GAMM|nr:DNA replication/repair protein RecF [Endozoicomonas montiporae]AMO54279.1 DNA replication and repair protein RecF [Endozoicomonas montiporae CL-33]
MTIHKLMVKDIRNLEALTIEPSPFINILYGLNGSGKTSVLEAIHLLGLARSFRSNRVKPVIRKDQQKCTVFGQVRHSGSAVLNVGVSRALQDENFQIRVSGENLRSTSALAQHLPLQLINPDTFRLLEGSPKDRRQFLDWGVFHVKQRDFIPLWKRLQKALKQRNSLLRHGRMSSSINRSTIAQISSELQVWNSELVKASEAVHQLRDEYFEQLKPVFHEVLSQLTELSGISLKYYRGWDKERSFSEVLAESLEKDIQSGYSQSGPQRADIRVRIDGTNAIDTLSRGQLKLVVCALKLAQGMLFYRKTGKQCVFLVDDLPSELDAPHRKALCAILQNMKTQVFITCVEQSALADCWLPEVYVKVFHVKQGRLEANEQIYPGREIRQAESLEIEHE